MLLQSAIVYAINLLSLLVVHLTLPSCPLQCMHISAQDSSTDANFGPMHVSNVHILNCPSSNQMSLHAD